MYISSSFVEIKKNYVGYDFKVSRLATGHLLHNQKYHQFHHFHG